MPIDATRPHRSRSRSISRSISIESAIDIDRHRHRDRHRYRHRSRPHRSIDVSRRRPSVPRPPVGARRAQTRGSRSVGHPPFPTPTPTPRDDDRTSTRRGPLLRALLFSTPTRPRPSGGRGENQPPLARVMDAHRPMTTTRIGVHGGGPPRGRHRGHTRCIWMCMSPMKGVHTRYMDVYVPPLPWGTYAVYVCMYPPPSGTYAVYMDVCPP